MSHGIISTIFPMKKPILLSLIVPIFKQEKTIVSALGKLKAVLDTLPYRYEIIAVVDGILDASYKKIARAKIPYVQCIAYKKNQGKSFALRIGMRFARGAYVMFIDADTDIDPQSIPILLAYMKWYDADIIVGSKRHPASIIDYPPSRKILSFAYYLLVKFLFGIRVHDTQAGIKIFKKSALRKILPRLVEKKFAGDLEILVVANYARFTKIYEAPIKLTYKLGGITSAATIQSIIRILIDTFAIFWRLRCTSYYASPHITPKGEPLTIFPKVKK